MIDSRLERATQRLESLSSQQSGLTPADLIERTSDELKTANYRKKELLPKTLQGTISLNKFEFFFTLTF